jgi:hypothetical protein
MTSSTSNTGIAGNLRSYFYRPSQLMFGDNGFETTTTWNYKVVGRYVLPYDFGLSGSWKVQSGYQYGRVTSVTFLATARRASVWNQSRATAPRASASWTCASTSRCGSAKSAD